MKLPEVFQEIIAIYRRHGWQLRQVLLCPETQVELGAQAQELFADAALREAALDALWFARPSLGGREAWELRLAAEQPYALLEAFTADQSEEQREEVRREMEARMAESISPITDPPDGEDVK
jgi:hypothetical protein